MSGRRPKDMTAAELEALPSGPSKMVFEPYTAEDYAKGAVGKGRVRNLYPKVLLSGYEPDDLAFFVSKYGTIHYFGQWADGQWFKS